MKADRRLGEALGFQHRRLRPVVVIGADLDDAHPFPVPFRTQPFRHRRLRLLALAVIADEEDPPETGPLQAARHPIQHPFIGLRRQAEGARILHVAGGRIEIPFGHQRQDGCNQHVADARGDPVGGGADDDIVLVEDHVRAVLFGPAARHQNGCIARGHGGADFRRGEAREMKVGRRSRLPCPKGGGEKAGKPKESKREEEWLQAHGEGPERAWGFGC